MLATAREPQADVTAMPGTSFQQQVSIPASFGAEIVPKTNLPDTQGVLNLIMFKYLQNVNPSTEEDFNGFLRYMRDVRQVAVVDTQQGSLIITVECSSLEILEGLWEDYRTGHLNDMAQKYLVTEGILKELDLIEVRLMTTILENEYRACREYFLQKPGLKLFVKTVTKKTVITLGTFPGDSVQDVKNKIMDEFGIPGSQQRLTLDGSILKDDHSLGDYNIMKNTVLHLVPLNCARLPDPSTVVQLRSHFRTCSRAIFTDGSKELHRITYHVT